MASATGGCFFSADYGGGSFACSDNVCPSGLECRGERCLPPREDAGVPPIDMMIDARIPAFTCADPGAIPSTGGSFDGTTVGRSNTVTSSCGGFVFNGNDSVYRIDLAAGKTLTISIAGGRKAYVLQPCVEKPSTPVCVGNKVAITSVPIAVNPAAGPSFIVVDDENPANTSTYMLGVTVN